MIEAAKQELIRAAQVLAAAGCLPATDGNFSIRLDNNRALITKRGVEKRNLRVDDFTVAHLTDEQPREASTEWQLHRCLYVARSEVNAIMHVHAPHLGAFAALGKLPDINLLIEAEMMLGGMALVPYVEPGTSALGEAAVTHGAASGVLVLARHGIVSVGSSVREAVHRMERAEFLARVELGARLLAR
ncbi:MAG: class II aldolase/adducin family protein [bacterium]|nr:class II aldolase/adducin family protein [bacterium]